MTFKTKIVTILSILMLSMITLTVNAQQIKEVTVIEKNELFKHLTRLVANNYVYPDIGDKIVENLETKLAEGYFDQFRDKDLFIKAVNDELRSINGDLHLRVKSISPSNKDEEMRDYSNELFENHIKSRKEFSGFNEVKNLGDGVGYLKLNYFRTLGMDLADSYMNLLKSSDAIIIDLRENRGGTVEMVQYLLSYFFDKQIQISTIVGRDGEGLKHYTLDKVNGKKLPDVPLFILVSNKTASGAEGFSYVLKNQKRGTIIGERTMGAAHSGGTWYIDGFSMFIPNERNISPITGTDWEKTGVITDIATTEDKAFSTAVNLAIEAAEKYREINDSIVSKMFEELWQMLEKADNETLSSIEIEKIHHNITALVEKGIINEGEINGIGYRYVELKMYRSAELVLKSNSLIYPNSINVYDSYAESLALNGKLEESVKNYKIAVKLAAEQKSGNLIIYQKNLDRAIQLLKLKN